MPVFTELGRASLHNHTTASFGDGRIPPETLVETAFGTYGFQHPPFVCVKGAEISCTIGEIPGVQRFYGIFLPRVVHLLVLCLPTDTREADRIPTLRGIEDVSRWARGLRAVVDVAHPAPTATLDRFSYEETKFLVSEGLVDYIEVTDPFGVSDEMVQLAKEAKIPGIATPDTHRPVGILPYIYTIFTDSSFPGTQEGASTL